MYFYMTTGRRKAEPLRKETERRSDERSAVRKGRIRETARERIGGDAVSKATHSNERKRSENGERPAPEGYKFMSMQHKVASTTSQPIHPPNPHLLQLSSGHLTPFSRPPLRHSSRRSYRSRQTKNSWKPPTTAFAGAA